MSLCLRCSSLVLNHTLLTTCSNSDDDSLRDVPTYAEKSSSYLEQAHLQMGALNEKLINASSHDVPLASFTSATDAEIKLRLTHASADVIENVLAEGPQRCHAEAFYDLGLIALKKAKQCGELRLLWSGHSVVAQVGDDDLDTSECDLSPLDYTNQAKNHFQCALRYANPASDVATKNILRCLALVTGPKDSTAFLVHTSVGGAARNIVRDALSPLSGDAISDKARFAKNEGRVREVFEVFDDDLLDLDARNRSIAILLKDMSSLIPGNWNISALATCPSGELLISTISPTTIPIGGETTANLSTICIFPEADDDAHTNILNPLDRIIERSQNQLSGMSEEAQSEQYNEESVRRKWWDERHKIDDGLQSLLKETQRKYFGHSLVLERLIPTNFPDDDNSECSDIGIGNLASRFEAAEQDTVDGLSAFDEEAEQAKLKKITVAALKERLQSLDVESSRFQKLRKAELIELLVSEMKTYSTKNSTEDPMEESDDDCRSDNNSPMKVEFQQSCQSDEPCTILILDEHLHRFPFESMPMFANKAVTRMPSLPFVLATLLETKSLHSNSIPLVDPSRLKYVLDPEKNLSETASTLGPALNSLACKNGWEWEGVISEMPSPEFMSQTLREENGLFLYCGHGGGENAFSRTQVEQLTRNDLESGCRSGFSSAELHRGCRSSVVLMGCSSGKLKSVNFPKDNPSGRINPIYYEPEGIALSYIFAGAPCVVGNLWDVTDRDIDR